jgi:DNA-binding transcriptional LysR family regulator
MFNMLQLQGFVAILEAGSFAQAAKRLRITQPPLTRHIRNLERELGYDLLVRTSKGVELTQRGARFAPDAKFIVETSQRIYDKSVGEAAAAKPQLRISFVATPPPGFSLM